MTNKTKYRPAWRQINGPYQWVVIDCDSGHVVRYPNDGSGWFRTTAESEAQRLNVAYWESRGQTIRPADFVWPASV